MSALQWALLILGTVAVIAIYVISRREKEQKRPAPPAASPTQRSAASGQMDIFGGPGQFDEFGVGKPRKRVPPSINPPSSSEPAVPAAAAASPAPPPQAPQPSPPQPPPAARPRPPVEERIFALLIAERTGAPILGARIHQALQEQGLAYGARRVYHRMQDGTSQYSVASIIKPGDLDPAEAESFSSPGLTVFMMLPGPPRPLAMFDDMLRTTQALAAALNAQVFNTRRQPLDEAAAADMRADVERWVQAQGLA